MEGYVIRKQFCLIRPIIAVQHRDGKSRLTTIPEGALLVLDGIHDANRLMRVRWGEEEMFVFAQDFRDRAMVTDSLIVESTSP
jgi:hypothetical protein